MSLQAINITKKYGTQKALNSVSFEIKTGEVVGFLGPNGAGKSTMMKIISGYIHQNSGNVKVNGFDTKDDIKSIKKQIGYLPEHNPLYLDMYVKEYLNFISKVYELKGNIKTRVNDLIEITGLSEEKNKKIGALSKGYRQRTGLAAALIHEPAVLILDEPTTGLDPNQIIEIRNLITKVGKEKTVMLSTHIMQEVEAICNRVIIINNGEIIAENSVSKIQEMSLQNKQAIIVEFANEVKSTMLMQVEGVENIIQNSEKTFILETNIETDIRANVFNFAVANQLVLLSMYKKDRSMEDVFRELTKK